MDTNDDDGIKFDADDGSTPITDRGLSVRHFFLRHPTENSIDGISMTAILGSMTMPSYDNTWLTLFEI